MEALAAAVEGADQNGNAWLMVPFLAVIAGAFWMSYRVSQGPKLGARQIGGRPGWSYHERDDSVLAGLHGWPFSLGSKAEARHVVHGLHRGRATVAFTYRFTRVFVGGVAGLAGGVAASTRRRATGEHDLFEGISRTLGHGAGGSGTASVSRDRVRVMVVAMELPEALPGFLVRIQLPTDRLMPGLRSNDLDLGVKLFDDAYLVRAEHPQLARDLLTPANQELLLRFSPYSRGPHRGRWITNLHDNPADGFTMWTAGRQLILLTNAHLAGEGYDTALDLMADFLDNVPPRVWDVAAGRHPSSSPSMPLPPPPPPPPAPVRSRPPDPPLSPSPISEA